MQGVWRKVPKVTQQGGMVAEPGPPSPAPALAGLFNSQVSGLPMRQPGLRGGWLVQKEGSQVKGVWETQPNTVLHSRTLMSMITRAIKLSLASCDVSFQIMDSLLVLVTLITIARS